MANDAVRSAITVVLQLTMLIDDRDRAQKWFRSNIIISHLVASVANRSTQAAKRVANAIKIHGHINVMSSNWL